METKYLTISSKNQITLNKEVRNALDVSSGDKVYFEKTEYGMLLKKAEVMNTCPICNGEKKVLNNQCLVCDGEGFIKENLNSKLVINKLVCILLNNNIDIDIKADEFLGYIIKSTSDNKLVEEYINRCQLFTIKEASSSFIDMEVLIPNSLKEQFMSICENKPYKEQVVKAINDIQLTVIKNILKKKTTISSDECDEFIEAFDEQYKDTISKFLLSFVSLSDN